MSALTTDHASITGCTQPRYTSDMKTKKPTRSEAPSVLDVVALLTDLSAERLARGQVGTIVEQIDDRTFLVEFSVDQGRAYAVVPRPRAELPVPRYVPEAA
jgi:hypothetical protein